MAEDVMVHVDAAVGINKGKRAVQEDAILSDFAIGSDMGLVVLADGMGGHNSGDVASLLVTTEVFRDLRYSSPSLLKDPESIPHKLWSAACRANSYIARHISEYPSAKGMGCTLVIAVRLGARLYWLSVGDSPIYLLRDGAVERLNEDHSLAPQIDSMVQQQLITAEQARTHPDRSLLTSAINGQKICQVDCRDTPLSLKSGDTVIVASDGLCSLDPDDLIRIVRENAQSSSARTSEKMLRAIRKVDCPNQDNVCFALLQISDSRADDSGCIDEVCGDGFAAHGTHPAPRHPPPKRQRPLTRWLKSVGGPAPQ